MVGISGLKQRETDLACGEGFLASFLCVMSVAMHVPDLCGGSIHCNRPYWNQV